MINKRAVLAYKELLRLFPPRLLWVQGDAALDLVKAIEGKQPKPKPVDNSPKLF